MRALLLLLLTGSVHALDVPYSIREPETVRDAAAINQNFRALADEVRKNKAIAKDDIRDDDNTWTGSNTFQGSVSVTTFSASGPSTFTATVQFSTTPTGVIHLTTQSARLTGITWGTDSTRIAASTLTLYGSTITVHAMGLIEPSASGNPVAFGLLINGACPAWATCTGACSAQRPEGYINPGDGIQSFTILERFTQAAGSVTVAVWGCATAGSTANGTLSNFWLEAN